MKTTVTCHLCCHKYTCIFCQRIKFCLSVCRSNSETCLGYFGIRDIGIFILRDKGYIEFNLGIWDICILFFGYWILSYKYVNR